jgi:hypothetical protein
MPTCVACDHYWRPVELGEGGTCPTCGEALDLTPPKTPWHFKLLFASAVAYLGWRAVEGVAWVIHRI